MRDALTIFDQTVAFCGTDIQYQDVIRNLNVLDYEYSFKMVEDFLAGNYGGAFLTLDEILAKGFNALHFVGSLSSHLRNLVVAKTGGLEPLLELPDSLKKRYQEQAARCSNQFLFEALGITTACETGYKAAVNPRLHIEFALMRLSYILGKPQAQIPGQAGNDAKPAPAPMTAPVPAPAIPSEASVGRAEDNRPSSERPAGPGILPKGKIVEGEKAAGDSRGRRPLKGSALSMSAIMEEKKEEEVAPEAVSQNQALPEDETVRVKWKELAGQYSAKPRLANMLSSGNINLSEDNGVKQVEFFVTNDAQKQWVEEKMLRELESKLRDLTGCQKVNVIVSVTPMEETEKVPYMPEEKAKDLMEKNPEVRAFVADLGLDTK
jgi:DNA polymerase-3 subunit gamma/tau